MTFFYNLNDKLNAIRATPEPKAGQLTERAVGKPGLAQEGIINNIRAANYERLGNRTAAQREKFYSDNPTHWTKPFGGQVNVPANMSRIIGQRYDKADQLSGQGKYASKPLLQISHKPEQELQAEPEMEEGLSNLARKIGSTAKNVGGKVLNKLGHGSDADLMRDLQRRMGVPQTGMKPGERPNPKVVREKMNPAKAKSFAALAPQTNKITFADKIAGAKKEVDEMLGDVAAEAMKSALGGGKRRQVADEASKDNAFTAHKRPREEAPKHGEVRHGAKHDTEEIHGGRRVTRRADAAGISVGTDDARDDGEKRGRGRPKGAPKAPERVTAKATKHKSGRKTNEGDASSKSIEQHKAEAADMLKAYKAKMAEIKGLDAADSDEDWKASHSQARATPKNVASEDEQPIAEKAVSKKQQRFMGMVHAAQKGQKPASKEVGKVAKEMPKKAATDFASTKQKGLPEKVRSTKEESSSEDKPKKVKEQGGTDTPTASSGFSYGQGIYDSMSRELENMIAESMSVNMSDSTEGGKSLTITGTDEDAVKLASILQNAGIGGLDQGQEHGQEMSTCDGAIDENSPDWPTNTETSNDAMQYAGGLNKPKSTGQTTVPVIAGQGERTGVYAEQEEDAIQRMMEMAGIKSTVAEGKMNAMSIDMRELSPQAFKAKYGATKSEMLNNSRKPVTTTDKATKDKAKDTKVEESIFALTNQWAAYKV